MTHEVRTNVHHADATPERALALLLLRGVVGLQFFMAGWWKVFGLGPIDHARGMFVQGFQESWIPVPLPLFVSRWPRPHHG